MRGARVPLTIAHAHTQTEDNGMNKWYRSAASRISTGLVLLLAPLAVLAQNGPPRAAVREVTDTYFGQTVVDPYRWMEDTKSAELSAWMKAQADYARAFLDGLPLRNELLKRINELSQTGVRVSDVERRGDRYFYYRRAEGDIDRKLYARDGVRGTERLLVDPEKRSETGRHYSLTAFSPSHDGKYVSYLISPGGSELGELRVMEVATGQEPEGPIAETRLDAGAWMPDDRSLSYTWYQKDTGLDRFQKTRVQLHTLGSPPEKDRSVFGYEVDPRIRLTPAMMSFMMVPQGSRYAVAMAYSGVSPNKEWYIAPIDAFDKVPVPWRRISTLDDEVSDIELHGDDVYCLTYKSAPRYKVARTSAARPDLANAPVVFAGGDAVVERVAAARDALYVQTLDGGSRRVQRVNYTTAKSRPVTLPYDGSASITIAEPDRDGDAVHPDFVDEVAGAVPI
jgi:prolyl oligopeptidase